MPTKITSVYTPLTYDEISKPLIQATEAHMALEDTYADIQDKADAMLAKADSTRDALSYIKLKNYANALQKQANELAANGLQSGSRQSLMRMRRKYGQEISPIAQAIERRHQLAEEQRKAYAANPYIRYQRDMSTTSLDQLVADPNMDYGKIVDLNDITRRAANYAKALGQLQTDAKAGRQVDKYMKEYLIRQGFTMKDIQDAIDGKQTPLGIALKNLYGASGAEYFSDNVKNEIWAAIEEGAKLGVGQVHSTIQQDHAAIRADQVRDRNAAWAREDRIRREEFNNRLALAGLKRDSNGKIVKDPDSPFNPGPQGKYEEIKVEGLGNVIRDENGTYFIRHGKNDFIELGPEDVATVEKVIGDPAKRAASLIALSESPLYFGGDNFDVERSNGNDFSEDDSGITTVDPKDLSIEARTKLAVRLGEMGLKIEDVTIYKDPDWFTRNEYKIVPKE